jgi:hypothetical protein
MERCFLGRHWHLLCDAADVPRRFHNGTRVSPHQDEGRGDRAGCLRDTAPQVRYPATPSKHTHTSNDRGTQVPLGQHDGVNALPEGAHPALLRRGVPSPHLWSALLHTVPQRSVGMLQDGTPDWNTLHLVTEHRALLPGDASTFAQYVLDDEDMQRWQPGGPKTMRAAAKLLGNVVLRTSPADKGFKHHATSDEFDAAVLAGTEQAAQKWFRFTALFDTRSYLFKRDDVTGQRLRGASDAAAEAKHLTARMAGRDTVSAPTLVSLVTSLSQFACAVQRACPRPERDAPHWHTQELAHHQGPQHGRVRRRSGPGRRHGENTPAKQQVRRRVSGPGEVYSGSEQATEAMAGRADTGQELHRLEDAGEACAHVFVPCHTHPAHATQMKILQCGDNHFGSLADATGAPIGGR